MGRFEPGDHVKAEFRDERGESEWMWVRVEGADDEARVVFGRLDNEPVAGAGSTTAGGSRNGELSRASLGP